MFAVSRRNVLKVGLALGAAALLPSLGRVKRVSAQAAADNGTWVTIPRGSVTLHTFVAPESSFLVTSHIIETENRLIIVDTQFLQPLSQAVRALADSVGKPIERIFLSHSHPDHWGGANNFADLPIFATAAVRDNIAAAAEGTIANIRDNLGLGDLFTDTAPVIENAIEGASETIDGVTFEYQVYNNAEDAEQVVIRLPEAGTLIVQDLLYSDAYFFPGVDRVNWIAILEEMRALEGYDLLLPGHGFPSRKGEVDNAIRYLTFFNESLANSETPEALIEILRAEYPSYGAAGILNFVGLAFQQ